MKQKLLKLIWIILVLIVIIICISTMGNVSAINPNSEKIAELTFKLSELEYSKMNCLDNLTYKQSVEQEKWFTKYCVEYDEQIMVLEAEIEDLKEWKTESETETAWTMENEFPFAIETNSKFCEAEIKQELRNIIRWVQDEDWFNYLIWIIWECDYKSERVDRAINQRNAERYPWKLTEDWSQQEMPIVMKANWSHEAFKELASAYWLDAWTIWNVENHYWIKEWVILCITVAETSWWNRWAGWKNIWSVGSNDRWDRPTYALMESWLEAIGKTLNNKYLGSIQTLWCLSNGWSCQSWDDNWKRYATSNWNRQRNMVWCLSTIYWKIDPATFSIRR